MKEVWNPVKGYEELYKISNFGNVENKNGKKIKQYDNKGYVCVDLSKNNIRKHYRVHRLVMYTFNDNKNHKLDINHIDGNKYNNRLDNLEWCTRKENLIHAVKHGLNSQSIKITAIKNNNFIKCYSISDSYNKLKELENIKCTEKTFKENVRRALHNNGEYYGYHFKRGVVI